MVENTGTVVDPGLISGVVLWGLGATEELVTGIKVVVSVALVTGIEVVVWVPLVTGVKVLVWVALVAGVKVEVSVALVVGIIVVIGVVFVMGTVELVSDAFITDVIVVYLVLLEPGTGRIVLLVFVKEMEDSGVFETFTVTLGADELVAPRLGTVLYLTGRFPLLALLSPGWIVVLLAAISEKMSKLN